MIISDPPNFPDQTLVALGLSALWALALGFGHWRGDLQFFDRPAGALTALRTIPRRGRAVPEVGTHLAIDEDTAGETSREPRPRAPLAGLADWRSLSPA